MPIIYNALIVGIFIGSIYGLIAVGLSLVYGVMRVVNISHGEFVMLGAFLSFFAWTLVGINPIICIAIALVALFFLGLIIHRSLVERVIGKPMLSSLMLTFGVSILIWNTAQAIFTTNIKAVSYFGASITFLGVNIAKSYILGFGIAVLLVVALFAFLKFSKWGKAIRATSQNDEVAMVCGIDTKKVRTLAFALGAAFAGSAGGVVAMTWFIFPQMGFNYLAKAFAIIVLGGLGSVPGALIGSLIYGAAESLAGQLLEARMSQVIPFVILATILVLKPSGLFGARER
ncbi:MAG: branched-chain amino acid ABC transporter permease [Promethearchaeota archaeon]